MTTQPKYFHVRTEGSRPHFGCVSTVCGKRVGFLSTVGDVDNATCPKCAVKVLTTLTPFRVRAV